jgi:DNA polymerase-3 subunit chi
VTEILFYHDAPDKLAAACQVVAERHGSGRRVFIYAPDAAVAATLDRMLWIQPAIGFLPHCSAGSPLAGETPVVIGASLDHAGHDDVLVNLGGELPAGFGRFRVLIEIVGCDEADRGPARARYRDYRDRGYPLAARHFSGAGRAA